jgi:perosamine synthetase
MVGLSETALAVPVAAGGAPLREAYQPLPDPNPRSIAPAAYAYVKEVLDSRYRANMIGRFEAALAEATGTAYATTAANCTAAIHIVVGALQYLGRLNVGDEVLVSPLTDYGSVMGVVAQGCIPVFPDVDPNTGNITGATVRAALAGRPRVRALIAVHFYGLLCPMDDLLEAAREHDLIIIEDVRQAPLAPYRSADGRVRRAGSMGYAGCFSFEGEKHISADHGGAITTNDQALIEACREFNWMRGASVKPG